MGQLGQWLEKALVDLCQKMESGLGLDRDMIPGLVSYCELADPRDAKEYLDDRPSTNALFSFGRRIFHKILSCRGGSTFYECLFTYVLYYLLMVWHRRIRSVRDRIPSYRWLLSTWASSDVRKEGEEDARIYMLALGRGYMYLKKVIKSCLTRAMINVQRTYM